jgi:hypothetical protein
MSERSRCVYCTQARPNCPKSSSDQYYCYVQPQTCTSCARCVCQSIDANLTSPTIDLAYHSGHLKDWRSDTKCVNFEQYNAAIDAVINRRSSRNNRRNRKERKLKSGRWTMLLFSKYLSFNIDSIKSLNQAQIQSRPKMYQQLTAPPTASSSSSNTSAPKPYLLFKPQKASAVLKGVFEPDIIVTMEINEDVVPLPHAVLIRDTSDSRLFIEFFRKSASICSQFQQENSGRFAAQAQIGAAIIRFLAAQQSEHLRTGANAAADFVPDTSKYCKSRRAFIKSFNRDLSQLRLRRYNSRYEFISKLNTPVEINLVSQWEHTGLILYTGVMQDYPQVSKHKSQVETLRMTAADQRILVEKAAERINVPPLVFTGKYKTPDSVAEAKTGSSLIADLLGQSKVMARYSDSMMDSRAIVESRGWSQKICEIHHPVNDNTRRLSTNVAIVRQGVGINERIYMFSGDSRRFDLANCEFSICFGLIALIFLLVVLGAFKP